MEKGVLGPIEKETRFILLKVNALFFKTTRSSNILHCLKAERHSIFYNEQFHTYKSRDHLIIII